MKKLIVALMLMLSANLMASDIYPLAGIYDFAGAPQILQSFQIEVVRLYRDQDRERLAELKGQGFTCDYVDSKTARCKRFEKVTELPPSLKNRLLARYQNIQVIFGELEGEPEVLHKGESYTEYLVTQEMSVGSAKWENYRYFESDDLHKVQTGTESPAAHSFVVDSADSLGLITLESSSTASGYISYLISAPFIRH